MFGEHTSAELILFFTLYGLTGAMALFAAVYLLLRRGNAFAPDVTPPVRLRRWAASFFAVAALAHVWWVGAKQLAHESGFSSYRIFSRAFTQCMGQSVTAWMNQSTE